MSIVKMKHLKLIGMQSERDELLHELTLLGCVQIEETGEDFDDCEFTQLLNPPESSLSDLKSKQIKITAALEALKEFEAVKSGLFVKRPEFGRDAFLSSSVLPNAMEIAGQIELAKSHVSHLRAEESQLRSQVAALEPWAVLDMDLKTGKTETCTVFLGGVPATAKLSQSTQSVYEASQLCEVITIHSDKNQHYLLVICHSSAAEDVSLALRNSGFAHSNLLGVSGTPQENISELNSKIESVRRETESFIEEIRGYGNKGDLLKLCQDRLAYEIHKEDARQKLVQTGSTFTFESWMSVPEEGEIKKLMERFTCAYELSDPSKEEIDDVPIKLKNNRVTRPLMMVSEMYSLPKYDCVDPNPVVMPFFVLFFGIMYADLGYGLVLIAAHFFLKKMMKPKGTLGHMVDLMLECGISVAVIGLLTGGFFADLIPTIASMAGIENPTLPPVLNLLIEPIINPTENPMNLLIISFILGGVHIIFGMVVNAYILIRDGKPFSALFDVGGWWLLFAGIAVGALGNGWYVAIAGVVVLVLTQGRDKKGIIGKLFGGLASLYDIVNYFGDVLSYSRLMALMLASSIFGSIINILGNMPGNIIAFIVIFLVGHLLNMLINMVGTYVHSARLQYLEFFGKFYKEGGRPFRPLEISTKYVDIIND